MLITIYKKSRPIIIIFILTILILYVLKLTKNTSTLSKEKVEVRTVETINIKLNDVMPEYLFYGNVKGINEVDIIAKLNGKIIGVSPKVLDSSDFKKGEVVFEIDDFKHKQELKKKEAIIKELKSELKFSDLIYKEVLVQLQLSEKDYKRKKKLYGDIVTKKGLEDALLNFSLAKARVLDEKVKIKSIESKIDIERAQIKLAKRTLNDAKYKAPFDGKISNSLIEVGAEVLSGIALGSFINTNLLNVKFFVGESVYADLGRVMGRSIKVIWSNSSFKKTYSGNIFNIDSTINKERSGLNMYARLENISLDDPIRPGVFVEVLIKGSAIKKAFIVDENSIYEDKYIYVLIKNTPVKRIIKVQGSVDNKLIITGDILENEEFIITRITNISGIKKLYSKNKNAK